MLGFSSAAGSASPSGWTRFPLGQFTVDLSSVSESGEILQLIGLCLSVCTKMLGVKKWWEDKIVGSAKDQADGGPN